MAQMEASLPEVKVAHGMFYKYRTFMDRFQDAFQIDKRLFVDGSSFKDGSAWLKVVVGDSGRESNLRSEPRQKAILPFWISTQFDEEAKVRLAVERIINALTHVERNRPALVDEVIGISPYLEMRQDKDGPGDGRGDRDVGEACDIEILAHNLYRLQKLMVFAPHSHEGMSYLKREIADVLGVTATPLFAAEIKEELFNKEVIKPENTRIVALDKGSLQQCVALSEQLGLNPTESIVAFDKTRKGQNMVGDHMLMYGNPEDIKGKDMIIYDDIIDTFGSMKKTCKSLRDLYHCNSITVIGTHGVLSFPARDNIISALDDSHGKPIVDRVYMSDSLPEAKYKFEEIPGVKIISVAQQIGTLARLFSELSGDEMRNNEYIRPYTFDPQDKDEVWAQFKQTLADPAKLHKAIGD